ncbi:unnamed protein product [Tuber melanosporum]|uniref:(Perigord truffle) hypothetical protein n=1 Tax=Tuber melanosporum (strain Mel28) TaxID=656061 RepID=D5G721_TUBMM|nr:uncharacterized protein GSTUM_00004564001 [Tuber melanosporum]CAZ80314.1 unnamed protein product [Tuber melanosporum]
MTGIPIKMYHESLFALRLLSFLFRIESTVSARMRRYMMIGSGVETDSGVAGSTKNKLRGL